ncbi:MAG: hypothetical protein ACT4QE_17225 [Anaerolineales bacterium]
MNVAARNRTALASIIVTTLMMVLSACTPEAAATSGEAVLTEIINNVQVGGNPGKFEPAKNGAPVSVGSLVRSGDNSLGKLLFSGGPFVRFSSNTTFNLDAPALPEEVRLKMEAGRLRLSLFGHLMAVQTPLGVVQLDGFGDVNYQIGASPEIGDDVLNFSCFSGPCLFQSDLAAAYLQLNSLEGLTVVDSGLTMTRTVLSELDLRQFILDNPGSVSVIATLTAQPTATSSATLTPTPTFTRTPTRVIPTRTASATPTNTRRPTQAFTPRPAFTATGSTTGTPIDTETPTPQSGGGGGPPPPTSTPVPPTPVPPTNTSPPPTNTPEPTVTSDPPTKTPSPSP